MFNQINKLYTNIKFKKKEKWMFSYKAHKISEL